MPDKADKQSKQEKLAEADQHIATAEGLLARQMSLVADLERDGHETESARTLVETMREAFVALTNLPRRTSDAIGLTQGTRGGRTSWR